MVLNTSALWLLGRVAVWMHRSYRPPAWWRVWLVAAAPLAVGITAITVSANQPTLPPMDAAACTAVTLLGVALALAPGSLAARRPFELGLLALDGVGVVLVLLLLRAVELPDRGVLGASLAYFMAFGGIVAAAFWFGIMTALRRWRRTAVPGAGELLVAGLCLTYLLLPLVHHLLLTPAESRYISSSSNFFARDVGMQLVVLFVAAVIVGEVARLRRKPEGASHGLPLAYFRYCFLVASCMLIAAFATPRPAAALTMGLAEVTTIPQQLVDILATGDLWPDHHSVAATSLNKGVNMDGSTRYGVISVTVDRIYRPDTGETLTLEGGLGAYDALMTYSSACVTGVSVTGVAPFSSVTANIAAGSISYNAYHTELTGPQSGTLAVIKVRLTGAATETCTITNTFVDLGSVYAVVVPQDAVDTITVRRGDAQSNNNIQVYDAMFIAQYVAGIIGAGSIDPVSAASVRYDGAGGDTISVYDAMFIAQYRAGIKNPWYQ